MRFIAEAFVGAPDEERLLAEAALAAAGGYLM